MTFFKKKCSQEAFLKLSIQNTDVTKKMSKKDKCLFKNSLRYLLLISKIHEELAVTFKITVPYCRIGDAYLQKKQDRQKKNLAIS
jgi:hypothetical protein